MFEDVGHVSINAMGSVIFPTSQVGDYRMTIGGQWIRICRIFIQTRRYLT